jgi:hypothetical protein
MIEHRVAVGELDGAMLDYWVAVARGWGPSGRDLRNKQSTFVMYYHKDERYSSDWAKGGPFIAENEIRLSCDDSKKWWAEIRLNSKGGIGFQTSYDRAVVETGGTALVAAMRCYVASKLGSHVERGLSR